MGNTDADEIASRQVQNTGTDDIAPEVNPEDEAPIGDELGSVDDAADGFENEEDDGF